MNTPTPRRPPTHKQPPRRDYSRLERYRQQILCPGTWGVLLADDSPLGSPEYVGRE